ncbi:PucR family transcriptional regulator [Streptomonospora mangrovi]|uniref:PucR family transcriptional regulator n=1 Tax=Streptomonospora mangrovi TaxID=2883123 RepID=UPI0022DD1DD0|nr:helix-turn-helix domain-containing protein [Streptomonospora mangrovi]
MPLRRLLLAVGDPLVDVLAAPGGLDVRVDTVVLADPEEEPDASPGDLVLLIGARGAAARHLVQAAARRGAAAVAVKVAAGDAAPPPGRGAAPPVRRGGDEAALLGAVAEEAGVALLAVRPEVRWDQLHSLCRTVLDDARLAADTDLGEPGGDLFSLAQTIAALTGGLVTVEDSASRVLAYSSGEEVDELRRLSVLGRRGPEQYLALLREWGVFSRLRAGEEVVRVEEHPELGIRRRLAVGIHAGAQPLGAIWVQEGAQPLSANAEEALLGAARMAALHLLRHRTESAVGLRLRDDLLASLLEGRIEAAALADTIEVTHERPALVVAFAPAPGPAGTAGAAGARRAGADPGDPSGRELVRRRLVDLVTVHTAAYRRHSLVTAIGGRIYVLMPDLARGSRGAAEGADASAEGSVLALTRKTVEAARATLGVAVQGAMGSPVDSLGRVAESRAEADRVLDAMGRDLAKDVATMSDVRTQVLISETLAYLRASPALRDPRVSALAAHDTAHNSDLVPSLLAYLEEFGDVRTASARLHVHPNTLRYRVRRAESISGIDLSDPTQRLFTHLQLLLERTNQ